VPERNELSEHEAVAFVTGALQRTDACTRVASDRGGMRRAMHVWIAASVAAGKFNPGIDLILDDYDWHEAMRILAWRRPLHPAALAWAHRDIAAIICIRALIPLGFQPTRSKHVKPGREHRRTGCDIVAKAMAQAGHKGVTYDMLRHAWDRAESRFAPPAYLLETE
jgi:hypothetical protein